MYGDDVQKILGIFAGLAEAKTKVRIPTRKRVIFRDNEDYSFVYVKGYHTCEQYQKAMRKEPWETLNKYCQWDEKNEYWRVMLNSHDDHEEIPDRVLKPKKLSPIH